MTADVTQTGRRIVGVLHAFLPILLVVLTEYGQDVLLSSRCCSATVLRR